MRATTSPRRWASRRYSARVGVWHPHLGDEVSRTELGEHPLASTLSVLTLAEAIAWVRIGFDTVTLLASSDTIAQVTEVDSTTRWSSGPSDAAKAVQVRHLHAP